MGEQTSRENAPRQTEDVAVAWHAAEVGASGRLPAGRASRVLDSSLERAARLATFGEVFDCLTNEFGNRLNTIVNCTQLVLDGDGMTPHLQTVLDEARRLNETIANLASFARFETSRPVATDVARVIESTLAMIGPSLRQHGIGVEAKTAELLPEVALRPQQLHQVLLSLLVNARDALVEPGARSTDRRIEVRAEIGQDPALPVSIAVRDNGNGIAEHVRDHIFTPFFTTKSDRGAHGLGLCACRQIVTACRGRIDFASVPGEFAEFRVALPRR